MNYLLKKSIFFLSVIAFVHSQSYDVIINEGFDSQSLPNGWTRIQGASLGWRFGTPKSLSSQAFLISNPFDEQVNGITASNDDNCYCDSSSDFLITPPLTIPNTRQSAFLHFRAFFTGTFNQIGRVQISQDLNGNYTTIYTMIPATGWQHISVDISSYLGTTVYIKFWSDDNGGWGSGFALDRVYLIAHSLNNISPQCSTSVNDGATFSLGAFSLNWATSDPASPLLPLGYSLSIGTDNPPSNIISNLDVSSSTSYNLFLSTVGTYYYRVVPYGFNAQGVNCSVWSFTVQDSNRVNVFPYSQGFETTSDWNPIGNFSSWQLGTPAKTKINAAASGLKSYVTGGLGSTEYNPNENSYLISPLFDFTSQASNAVFSMKIWYEVESRYDAAAVQYSIDFGNTWNTLPFDNDTANWYRTPVNVSYLVSQGGIGWSGSADSDDGSNGYLQVVHVLPNTAGQAFYVRIQFASDAVNEDDGVSVDDIFIDVVPTQVPKCALLVFPTDGQSELSVLPQLLQWARDPTENPVLPLRFLIYLGIIPQATGILNGTNLNLTTSYNFPNGLPLTYYWRIVPIGFGGITGNCPIWTFRTNVPVIDSFPYIEDFEISTGSWTPAGTRSSWAWGTPNKRVIKGAASGTKAWVTGGLGLDTYNNQEDSWVLSPAFNFSQMSNPWIQFSIWYQSEFSFDGTVFQYSLDSGLNWNRVGNFNDSGDGIKGWYNSNSVDALYFAYSGTNSTGVQDGWSGRDATGSKGWITASHPLVGLAGTVPLFRVAFGSGQLTADDGFGFDNVRLFDAPINTRPQCAQPIFPTAGATNVPLTPFDLQWTSSVAEIPGLPIGYFIRWGASNPPNTTTSFQVDVGSATRLATQFKNLTTYYWQVIPYGYNGLQAINCPIWSFTTGANIIQSLPYSEDFESGQGNWISGGSLSSWTLGNPSKSVIIGCASGTNCWVNGGLTGTYNANEQSYVLSPVFNFTRLTADPVFAAKIWFSTERSYDGAVLQASVDYGTSWAPVGGLGGDVDWYNGNIGSSPGGAVFGWSGNNSGWTQVSKPLNGLAGRMVFLRIAFSSDSSNQRDGFAIDDVRVVSAPVGVTPSCASLVSPVNGASNLPVTDFPLSWISNDVNIALPYGYVVYFGTTNPPTQQTDVRKLRSFSTGNKIGTTYYWQVVPYGHNNIRASNCPVWSFSSYSVVINSFPYSQNFESDNGGWTAGGTLSTWVYGTPRKATINSAASGSFCWMNGQLTSVYNLNERSFLQSPVFNFSVSIVDPVITFKLWTETENGYDGLAVQVSTDAGQTWTTVGNVENSWYNSATIGANPGGQGRGFTGRFGGWRNMTHSLTGTARQSLVTIRFVFASDNVWSFEGVAIDDIQVTLPPTDTTGLPPVTTGSITTGISLTSGSVTSGIRLTSGFLTTSRSSLTAGVSTSTSGGKESSEGGNKSGSIAAAVIVVLLIVSVAGVLIGWMMYKRYMNRGKNRRADSLREEMSELH